MKRMKVMLIVMLMLAAMVSAFAEDDINPVLKLFDAEEALLFRTDNVTVNGHAEFSLDGVVFKKANLLLLQDGELAVRDWMLVTPDVYEFDMSSGYTIVTGR